MVKAYIFSCGIGFNDELGCLHGYEMVRDLVEHN